MKVLFNVKIEWTRQGIYNFLSQITYKIYSRYDDSYCGRDYDYEDCYDDVCVEYRCPICGNFNSVLKSDLDKHRVIYVENSDESIPSTKEIRFVRDTIIIGISLFVGFVGAMLVNSIFWYIWNMNMI